MRKKDKNNQMYFAVLLWKWMKSGMWSASGVPGMLLLCSQCPFSVETWHWCGRWQLLHSDQAFLCSALLLLAAPFCIPPLPGWQCLTRWCHGMTEAWCHQTYSSLKLPTMSLDPGIRCPPDADPSFSEMKGNQQMEADGLVLISLALPQSSFLRCSLVLGDKWTIKQKCQTSLYYHGSRPSVEGEKSLPPRNRKKITYFGKSEVVSTVESHYIHTPYF